MKPKSNRKGKQHKHRIKIHTISIESTEKLPRYLTRYFQYQLSGMDTRDLMCWLEWRGWELKVILTRAKSKQTDTTS